MLYNRNYSLYPVLTIQYWTEYAMQHNQIKVPVLIHEVFHWRILPGIS